MKFLAILVMISTVTAVVTPASLHSRINPDVLNRLRQNAAHHGVELEQGQSYAFIDFTPPSHGLPNPRQCVVYPAMSVLTISQSIARYEHARMLVGTVGKDSFYNAQLYDMVSDGGKIEEGQHKGDYEIAVEHTPFRGFEEGHGYVLLGIVTKRKTVSTIMDAGEC